MTGASSSKPPLPPEVQEYVQVWAGGLGKVLNQVASASFAVEPEVPPEEASAANEKDLVLLIVCSGSVRGEMLFRLPVATMVGFAQLLMGDSLDLNAESTAERREAAEELIRQVTGQVATELKARLGEIQLRVDSAAAVGAWAPAAEGWISLRSGPSVLWLEYKLSAALVAALRPAPSTVPTSNSSVPDSTLELLMDVELEASLRFGGRHMLLREILELDAGSVVELDRQVQQSADLLLDGKLVARGEVVVVEGNYGLRITEVTSLAAAAGRRS